MSFSVWNEKPQFTADALGSGERIYRVGDKWVVTDQGIPTAQQVDATVAVATLQDCVVSVQAWLDAAARSKGYDGILSASTYATSKHAKFGPEGVAYRDWRDAVWDYCYAALAEVRAGKRAAPEPKQLIAELPPAPT